MTKQGRTAAILAAITANAIFGAAFPFTKFIFDEKIGYYVMLSWRMLFAFAVMGLLALFGILKLNYRGKKVGKLLPVALCEPCFYFIFESYGIDMTTASESAVIIAMIPIGVMLAAFFLLRERISVLQAFSVVVSVAGVLLLIVGGSFEASFSLPGYLFLFAAVGTAVFYNIGVRHVADEFSSVEITFFTVTTGMVFFNAISLVKYGLIEGSLSPMLAPFVSERTPALVGSILFLALASSVLAFVLINFTISRIGATGSSSFAGVTSLVSVAGGVIFLNERLSALKIAGIALIVLGVYGANRRARVKKPPASAA